MTRLTTMQQVFETAATRLLEQNAKSLDDDGTGCMYFNPNGLSCAVGLLFRDAPKIKEAIIDHDLNQRSLGQLLACLSEVRNFFAGLGDDYESTMRLLAAMQSIHDTNPPDEWGGKLLELGRAYQLDVSFLTEQPQAA